MTEPLVTHAWCRATGGALTVAQRRALRLRTLRTLAGHGVGLVRVLLGRRPADGTVVLPTAPASTLTEAALAAARDQGPDVEAHGLRTWLFGGALAAVDGVAIDPELLHVAGICHDAGLAEVVPGEDFTLRSADVAVSAFEAAGRPLDAPVATALRDGIVAHLTPGVTAPETVLGHYVQAGALLDLSGVRLADLPAGLVREVFARHPAGGIRDSIRRAMKDEARAVPDGRFAQSVRMGLPLAVRLSPTLRP